MRAIGWSGTPVAEGSFEGAESGVDQGVPVGVGAADFYPVQACLVEEAEVAPQGVVVSGPSRRLEQVPQCCHVAVPGAVAQVEGLADLPYAVPNVRVDYHMAPAGVPSYWLVYFSVDDVDVSFKKALAGGAREMLAPQDFAGGRFGILVDPQGATFGLLKTT